MAEGIEVRTAKDGTKSYRASVWSQRDRKLIRKTFPTKAAAKTWRSDAQSALRRGVLRPPERRRLEEAGEAWLEGARTGQIRNRSGDPYKPSAIRSYERNLRLKVLPEFGRVRVSDLRRTDVQDFVEKMNAEGLSPSTIDCALNPLRAIYRRAVARGEVGLNPIRGLELPRGGERRDRIASPAEAVDLLAAVPDEDRAIWATAMYAGLRRGELMALGVEHVDVATGLIHVERNWDSYEGFVALKSKAGKRRVPIAAVLRDHLLDRKLAGAEGLIFGEGDKPFQPEGLQHRADDAWKAAGLTRITPHECRHSYASLMIAAGVNAKALSTYMGHANIAITLDRYGHLMPGSEDEAASLLDAYLARGGQEENPCKSAINRGVAIEDGVAGR